MNKELGKIEEAIQRLRGFKNIKVMYGNTLAMHIEQLEQMQDDIETIVNMVIELKKEKQATIELLEYRIKDSKEMLDVCKKQKDIAISNLYEGKVCVSEEILNYIKGVSK